VKDIEKELDREQTYPTAWCPRQPGEQIIGLIERYPKGADRITGKQVHIAWIATDGGERHSLWLNNAVLLNKFAELRPKPGERVGVRFLGPHPDKKYNCYRVVIDRPDTAAGIPEDLVPVPVKE